MSNETKPDVAKSKASTATTKAPSPQPSRADAPPLPTIPLKTLCAEIKLDPRLAREKLRIAVREPEKYPELSKTHKARRAWAWEKDSAALCEARAVLIA